MITRIFGVRTTKRSLLRNYLQWYQRPTWLIYAARNQNLSTSSPVEETHYNSLRQEKASEPRRGGHSPQ